MTLRSIIFGLLGAFLVSGVTFFSDEIMRNTFLVGNFLPISVFGGLLIILLIVNPILKMFSARAPFKGAELAVIVALMLFPCCWPGRGTMHFFSNIVMLPHKYIANNIAWEGGTRKLNTADVTNWAEFVSTLRKFEKEPKDSIKGIIWSDISAEAREAMELASKGGEDVADAAILQAQVKLIEGLNLALAKENLLYSRLLPDSGLDMPQHASFILEREPETLSAKELLSLNRAVYDELFRGSLEARLAGTYESIPPNILTDVKSIPIPYESRDVVNWNELVVEIRNLGSAKTELKSFINSKIEEDVRNNLSNLIVIDTLLLKKYLTGAKLDNTFEAKLLDVSRDLWDTEKSTVALSSEELDKRVEKIVDEFERRRIVKDDYDIVKELFNDRMSVVNSARANALDNINDIIYMPQLTSLNEVATLNLPRYTKELLKRGAADLTSRGTSRVNRAVIDEVFKTALRGRKSRADEYVSEFAQGITMGRSLASPSQITWSVWTNAWIFWIPVLLGFAIASTGLAMVVHRQWTSHEHLPYPTVEFAATLLPNDEKGKKSVFTDSKFWLGLSVILFIHVYNYISGWLPEYTIAIPRWFDFGPLIELVPIMKKGSNYFLFHVPIYFTAVGFAYFLSTSVSFSLGIAPYVFCLIMAIAATYGLRIGGWSPVPSIESFMYAGGFIGMFILLVYTGRRYYVSVFRKVFGMKVKDEVEKTAVAGGWLSIIGIVMIFVSLMMVGVSIFMAAAFTALTLIGFIVITRMVTEAGAFYTHMWFFPSAILVGLFGTEAIGADSLVVLQIVGILLCTDPRETLMPFVATALNLVERRKVSTFQTVKWGKVALIGGFGVAVFTSLIVQYSWGATNTTDVWPTMVPARGLTANTQVRAGLHGRGVADSSRRLSTLESISKFKTDSKMLIAMALTMGTVFLLTFLRWRLSWWPLHPIIFLALGSWQTRTLAFSFLVGSFIKLIVTKYGGAKIYNAGKIVMVGVIAGDIIGGIIPVIVNMIYYMVTGEICPVKYTTMPM